MLCRSHEIIAVDDICCQIVRKGSWRRNESRTPCSVMRGRVLSSGKVTCLMRSAKKGTGSKAAVGPRNNEMLCRKQLL